MIEKLILKDNVYVKMELYNLEMNASIIVLKVSTTILTKLVKFVVKIVYLVVVLTNVTVVLLASF